MTHARELASLPLSSQAHLHLSCINCWPVPALASAESMAVRLIDYLDIYGPADEPARPAGIAEAAASSAGLPVSGVATRWGTPTRPHLSSTGEVPRKDEYLATQARSPQPS